MEGWKKRQTEHNLNNWANDLDIHCDGEGWEKRWFSGKCQNFCFGHRKYEMPVDIQLKVLTRLLNVGIKNMLASSGFEY